MAGIVLSFLQAAALVAGLLFLYLSLFVYEDEQKQIHDRLAELWVVLDDKRQRREQRQFEFAARTLQYVSVALDRVFGSATISPLAVLQSINLSIASNLILNSLFAFSARTATVGMVPLVSLGIGMFFLGVTVRATRHGNQPDWVLRGTSVFGGLVILSPGCLAAVWILSGHRNQLALLGLLISGAWAFAIAFNTTLIVTTRTILDRLRESRSPRYIHFVTGSNFTAVVMVCLTPLLVARGILTVIENAELEGVGLLKLGTVLIANLTSFAIAPALVVASLFLGIAATLTVGRVAAGGSSRLLYSAQKHRLVLHQKALFGISVFLLGSSGLGAVSAMLRILAAAFNVKLP